MQINNNIVSIQNEIIANFKYLASDRLATIEYIIDIGNELPTITEKERDDNNLITGCASKVWITHEHTKEGTLIFKGDSNTTIVKGLLSLIIKIFYNQKPKDIISTKLFFIEEINLNNIITSQRFIGVNNIINHIKLIANRYI